MDSTRHYGSAFSFEERVFRLIERIHRDSAHISVFCDRKAQTPSMQSVVKSNFNILDTWNRRPDSVIIDRLNKSITIVEVKERLKGGSVDEKFAAAPYWKDYWERALIGSPLEGYSLDLFYYLCHRHNKPKLTEVFNRINLNYSFLKEK